MPKQADGLASASPAIESTELVQKPEVLSAIAGQSISFLPSAYRGARVIGTDTLRIPIVLEVSSREQEPEQRGEDYPNVEAHREEPRAPAFGRFN